jgi:hypothetical protein
MPMSGKAIPAATTAYSTIAFPASSRSIASSARIATS